MHLPMPLSFKHCPLITRSQAYAGAKLEIDSCVNPLTEGDLSLEPFGPVEW